METYFILLVTMSNLIPDGSGQGIKLEEVTVVAKRITYCFIEWNNTLWVELYFGSLLIFLEVNKC